VDADHFSMTTKRAAHILVYFSAKFTRKQRSFGVFCANISLAHNTQAFDLHLSVKWERIFVCSAFVAA
jgi:hypothetical protein